MGNGDTVCGAAADNPINVYSCATRNIEVSQSQRTVNLQYEVNRNITPIESTFQYQPLQNRTGNIRLLDLHRALSPSSQIAGELRTSLLDRFYSSYEALSYTWVTQESEDSILLRRTGQAVAGTLSLGRNLDEALRYIRRHDRVRMIWIDAICINQQDNSEKTDQVASMGQIYALASNVIIWVGTEPKMRMAEP